MAGVLVNNGNKMVVKYRSSDYTVHAFAPSDIGAWYKYAWYFSLRAFAWSQYTDDRPKTSAWWDPKLLWDSRFWKDTIWNNVFWKESAIPFTSSELLTLRASIESENCSSLLDKPSFSPEDVIALKKMNQHKKMIPQLGFDPSQRKRVDAIGQNDIVSKIETRLIMQWLKMNSLSDWHALIEMLEYIGFFDTVYNPLSDSIKKTLEVPAMFQKLTDTAKMEKSSAWLSREKKEIQFFYNSFSREVRATLKPNGNNGDLRLTFLRYNVSDSFHQFLKVFSIAISYEF
jgi:hypothetical protein